MLSRAMIRGDPGVEQLKLRMDLQNLQHFLLVTPPDFKREQFDAELKKLWARWDRLDATGVET